MTSTATLPAGTHEGSHPQASEPQIQHVRGPEVAPDQKFGRRSRGRKSNL